MSETTTRGADRGEAAAKNVHTGESASVNGDMNNNECDHEPLLLETLPVYPITVNLGDELRYRVTKYGCSILRGREGVCRIRELSPTMKREWVAHIDEKQEDGTFKASLCRFWEHGIEFAYLDGGDFHPFYWRAIPEQVREELKAKAKPEHDRIRAARRRYGW